MAVTVEYCQVCGLPFEYCEFGPSPAECIAKNGSKSAGIANTDATTTTTTTASTDTNNNNNNNETESTESKLSKLKMVDDSKEDGHTSTTTTTTAADGSAPAAAAAPAKKKKEKVGCVVIEVNNRNKRKYVTTVTGLDLFDVKLADAKKLMAKKFSCGCAVVKNAAGGEEIDIQGDFQEDLIDLIIDNYPQVPVSEIYIMEDKKKVRARR